MKKESCIFCKIVSNEAKSFKIWEDKDHLAFLSIYPNTDGFTVVIPKKHYSSYGFAQTDNVITNLLLAAKKVALIIDSKFKDVGRTGLIMEGFGVDHLHLKLFPMHGTKMKNWKPVNFTSKKFFKKYEGYISSHDSARASDDKLDKIANVLRT